MITNLREVQFYCTLKRLKKIYNLNTSVTALALIFDSTIELGVSFSIFLMSRIKDPKNGTTGQSGMAKALFKALSYCESDNSASDK